MRPQGGFQNTVNWGKSNIFSVHFVAIVKVVSPWPGQSWPKLFVVFQDLRRD